MGKTYFIEIVCISIELDLSLFLCLSVLQNGSAYQTSRFFHLWNVSVLSYLPLYLKLWRQFIYFNKFTKSNCEHAMTLQLTDCRSVFCDSKVPGGGYYYSRS